MCLKYGGVDPFEMDWENPSEMLYQEGKEMEER